VLLDVDEALLALDEPLWFVVAAPPVAVLDAGAFTVVLPPWLEPRSATLLPLAATTGTLTTEPDEALPPFVFAEFDCDDELDWLVVLLDDVDEP
jgi:hypothetical protein